MIRNFLRNYKINARYLYFVIVFFSMVLIPSLEGFTHPLDISFTTLTPRKYGLYCETYIHPYELDLLLGANRKSLAKSSIKEIEKYLIPYFKKHFKVYQNGKEIQLYKIHFKEKSVEEIFGYGLYLIYKIPSQKGMKPIFQFKITLFNEYFSTQTNKIMLLDSQGKFDDNPEVILTKLNTSWICDVDDPDFSNHEDDGTDTDGDGLTDHMERNYGYNPKKKDSDGDGYNDLIEFSQGYDPLNRKSHP